MRVNRAVRMAAPVAWLFIVVIVAACSTGAGSASPGAGSPVAGSPSAEPTSVQVTLQEWAVVPAEESVAAGQVTFQVTNTGPEDAHEFVVLKTDLDPGSLPTDATGAVTEEGEGIEVIDEIEEVPIGEDEDLTVSLAAGKYVLLCNIYDEDEKEAHYQMGMRIAFTVTE
jgi:uncharacterized cupredoxin-like copper-binding protein